MREYAIFLVLLSSLQLCLAVNKICQQPIIKGSCEAHQPLYAWNKETGRCESFDYSGCGGNDNTFPNLDDCLNTCGPERACFLPVVGDVNCSEVHRFYFDTTRHECVQFNCNGNGNSFHSFEDCLKKCRPRHSDCFLNTDKGDCDGQITRYYYNPKLDQCNKFIYGGCGGNENNFENFDRCSEACLAHNRRDNNN